MTALGLLLAALIGIAIGILGGGGAILAIPIFVYVMGFGAKEAIASSLVVVGVTSLVGSASHWQEGRIKLRIALVFGVFAMAGAYLGAQFSSLFSEAVQLVLFAAVMLVSAFFMFRSGGKSDEDEEEDSEFEGGITVRTILVLLPLGVGIGVLTGLVGVGGGFLIVPALTLIGKVPIKEAVGTSLLVIALNSASGFVGYLGQVEVQWGVLALFTAVAVAGSFAGTYLVRFFPSDKLQRAFAAFLVVMAIFIVYQNRSAIPLVQG